MVVGDDGVEVFDRAIDVNTLPLDAGDRRNERGRAGGQHEDVVGNFTALLGVDDLGLAIDPFGPIADVERNAVFLVPGESGKLKLRRVAMREIVCQVDPIVGVARFFAEGDDLEVGPGVELDQAFEESVADHAVADDDDGLFPAGRVLCNHSRFVAMRGSGKVAHPGSGAVSALHGYRAC